MNKVVSLLRYAKVPDLGWRRGAAVIGKTGKLKPDYMIFNGAEIHAPEGHYQLRTYKGRRPSYVNVGNDPSEALAARNREQKVLELRNAGVEIPEKPERRSLYQLKEKFLEKYAHGSDDLVYNYTVVAEEFVPACSKTYPEQIEDIDVIRYCRGLQARGLADRTRANRYVTLRCFLRFCGIDPSKLISKEDNRKLKKYVKTEPETYTDEEIAALIEHSSSYLALVWEAFLKTGFRDEELAFLEWSDIDWVNKTITIRRKPGPGLRHWRLLSRLLRFPDESQEL